MTEAGSVAMMHATSTFGVQAKGLQLPEDPGFFLERVDPNRPFTMSSDGNGASVDLHFRAPPFLATALTDLVESKHTEYARLSDVLRDLVYQGCRWWHGQLGAGSPPNLTLGMAMAQTSMRAEERKRAENFVKDLEAEESHQSERHRESFVADVLIARRWVPDDMQTRVLKIMERQHIEDL